MARNRTARELARYVSEEYGGVTTRRGTPYSCNQQQIDDYTLMPYCYEGDYNMMSEREAIGMLQAFLDPNIRPSPTVRAALHRIADGMHVRQWYPDVVIKAAHDIDTAFFMGRLWGNVRITWVSRAEMVQARGRDRASVLGITLYLNDRNSRICLNLESILEDDEFPHKCMWQTIFHEMIHAFCNTMCHMPAGTSYDRSRGWTGGHGYMFRQCLQAIQRRTMTYFEGFRIATYEDDPYLA